MWKSTATIKRCDCQKVKIACHIYNIMYIIILNYYKRSSKHVDNNNESAEMPISRNICYMTVQPPHSTSQATQAAGGNSVMAQSSELCTSYYETVDSEPKSHPPAAAVAVVTSC